METQNPINFPLPCLPIFFLMFSIIYLIAYFIVLRNWSPKIRPEASSCLISHGTPAVLLSTYAILSDPATGFAAPYTLFENSVLDYSVAYFLTDLLHYLVFFPSDVLFIGHHLATLFVFLTCRYVASHGAFAILSLLILAEVTILSLLILCLLHFTFCIRLSVSLWVRISCTGWGRFTSWIVVVMAAISVSILWISNLWVELFRARTGELEKKTRYLEN